MIAFEVFDGTVKLGDTVFDQQGDPFTLVGCYLETEGTLVCLVVAKGCNAMEDRNPAELTKVQA